SSEIENLIAYQIGALQAIATPAGYKVTHVKAHGAISHHACEDDMTAQAIDNGIKAVDPNLDHLLLANAKLVKAGERANLPMAHEVFADRAYEDDGNLVSRRKPGALLHDAREIADRVVRMVQDGAVVSVTGKVIKMRTDTVCIHGDNPAAVEIARGVRKALKDSGIDVAPFKSAAYLCESSARRDVPRACRTRWLRSPRTRCKAPRDACRCRTASGSARRGAGGLPPIVRAWLISN